MYLYSHGCYIVALYSSVNLTRGFSVTGQLMVGAKWLDAQAMPGLAQVWVRHCSQPPSTITMYYGHALLIV